VNRLAAHRPRAFAHIVFESGEHVLVSCKQTAYEFHGFGWAWYRSARSATGRVAIRNSSMMR
jgi:hypothetical protein